MNPFVQEKFLMSTIEILLSEKSMSHIEWIWNYDIILKFWVASIAMESTTGSAPLLGLGLLQINFHLLCGPIHSDFCWPPLVLFYQMF